MATLQTLPDTTTFLPPPASPGLTTLAARSFFYAVFKHGRLVIGVFLLVFLAAAVSAFLRPSTWRANTKVLVKLGETVQVAPAETPSRSVNLPLTPEVVKTEAEIVRSSEVIKRAVERLGIQPESDISVDEMVSKMQLALTVTPAPGSNVLQISYLGRSPERAARMVNAITDVYLDQHSRVYRNEGIRSFYSDQLRSLQAEMKESQRRLRDYLKREQIVDADQEIELLNKDVIEQEKGMRAFRAKLRGTERKVEQVRAQVDRTPAQVAYSEEYHVNPTLEQFKTRLAALELERMKVLQAYLPNDRHVTEKDEEIASLKARIRDEKERVLGASTMRTNDLRAELQKNAFTLEVLLSDLRAREPGLRRRFADSRRRLRTLRDKRFTITNLKQDVEAKVYAFDLYRKKEKEAGIQEAMQNQSMVNVSVVEHAMPPLDPENGLLLPLLLGLAGGLGLAAGLAVAVEYLNRRLRFEEEVERYLELPVLAVIPDLESTAAIARG
ncbi:MAG TPA: Wzz/FepE/Etk N-terminal domain-containing protein [Candidatus Binatia bacterium]|nr:Wzz/FepE/Etk N-terminal domain-containing protein [Candidatus Binatia bacterium]